MDWMNVLSLIGGLCLFLFGMNMMGQALERRAGGKMHSVLTKMTSRKLAGFFTGCGVTAVIQSSSAATVMVVGFVNSGLMTLKQAVNVIMGANVGTTVTGWVLSLGGISGDTFWVRMLKPSSFTPILALLGIILYMASKKNTRKDTGAILLSFATLMFGMETMTAAVSGLADVPGFRQLFLMFTNPLLGLLVGAVLTMVIQSSSASVGILQALAMTGQISFGAAIPIVMGDAIGTCVTAMISSVGAKKDAKRAAVVHLLFNIIGAGVWLGVYVLIRAIFAPAILADAASPVGIAIVNTAFKVLSAALLLPMSALLEKMAVRLVPDAKVEEKSTRLDRRLLATPPLALGQSRAVTLEMAETAFTAMRGAIGAFIGYTPQQAERIRAAENSCDEIEDAVGTYLIKLSTGQLGQTESEEAAVLLKVLSDFERISDHAVSLLNAAEELREKNLTLTEAALREYDVITAALLEEMELTERSFRDGDMAAASRVEPLSQVIDDLRDRMRTHHILRMQEGKCSVQAGFVWADILADLERVSDHCSNVAGCVIDTPQHNLNVHESLRLIRGGNAEYSRLYREYTGKYAIAE